MKEHAVRVVPSLAQGLAEAREKTFDVFLVDYDLDDGKGDAFVREIRATDNRVPIVAVSAKPDGNDALMVAGATAVCTKANFSALPGLLERLTAVPRGTMLQAYTIHDDVSQADLGAIEVTVTLASGITGWCFFMTPFALANVGDWVPGTTVRMHLGELHMFVVSEISADIIGRVLRELAETGELERRVRKDGPVSS
jgi:CheY-like chemotaxis protein